MTSKPEFCRRGGAVGSTLLACCVELLILRGGTF